VNLPTRRHDRLALDCACHRWTEEPAQWSAIHFHNDDIGDAGWTPSLTYRAEDWASGVYACILRKTAHATTSSLCARCDSGSQAKVAFLAPTFTYRLRPVSEERPGGADHRSGIARHGAHWHKRRTHPNTVSHLIIYIPTAAASSCRRCARPLIDKRVNQIHLATRAPMAPASIDRGRQLHHRSADAQGSTSR